MSNIIPQKVKESASFLIKTYGDHLKYIGKYQKSDVYQYVFPENTVTGYPFVFLYNPTGDVQKITGYESFEIIELSRKNN